MFRAGSKSGRHSSPYQTSTGNVLDLSLSDGCWCFFLLVLLFAAAAACCGTDTARHSTTAQGHDGTEKVDMDDGTDIHP